MLAEHYCPGYMQNPDWHHLTKSSQQPFGVYTVHEPVLQVWQLNNWLKIARMANEGDRVLQIQY